MLAGSKAVDNEARKINEKLRRVIEELFILLKSSKLQQQTNLKARSEHETRCTSIFNELKLHAEVRVHV